MATAALQAFGGRLARDNDLVAVLAVPRRNAVSPPQLTRDTPIVNIAHPLEVRLGVVFGNKLDGAVLHDFDGAVGQRLDLHKPLRRKPGFYDGLAALALAQRNDVILRARQEATPLQVFQYLLPRLETVQPLVGTGVLI